jgi:hypothetical protein
MPIEHEGKWYPGFQERDAEWQGSGATRVRPQCLDCAHYDLTHDRCPAFPEPGTIPLSIRLNDFDHKASIYPRQIGTTRWEAKGKG